MKYLNFDIKNLNNQATKYKEDYLAGKPFPHVVIDNFFREEILDSLIGNFPKNISDYNLKFDNFAEKKLALNKPEQLSDLNNDFINFLNSYVFINFLQKITSIKESLVADPYLIGGGLHELRNEGFLNIHAAFNIHPKIK